MSRAQRRATRGSARSRRTPVRPARRRGPRLPLIPLAVVVGIAVVIGAIVYLIWQQTQPTGDTFGEAARIEADNDPSLPGEWVNLAEAYAEGGELARYGGMGGPGTGDHVEREMDYASEQGLPPAGGPHWGKTTCTDDPDTSSPFCGPVLPGIYRKPWPEEALVHTMEHAGVVIWYNTTDQAMIDQLEDFAKDNDDKNLALVPYPDMEAEHVAISVWSRRDKFPVGEYDRDRLDNFIDALYCRFDPEGFC